MYSLFTDTSIGKLYAGGFVVGTMVAALFMIFIFGYGLATGTRETATATTWRQRLASLVDLAPTMALIFLVLGTIYLGLATATEAAFSIPSRALSTSSCTKASDTWLLSSKSTLSTLPEVWRSRSHDAEVQTSPRFLYMVA